MSKLIYLDNAATTKTAPEVFDAMLPYFSEYYGNPSSIYDFAQKSKEAVTKGRQQIADAAFYRRRGSAAKTQFTACMAYAAECSPVCAGGTVVSADPSCL